MFLLMEILPGIIKSMQGYQLVEILVVLRMEREFMRGLEGVGGWWVEGVGRKFGSVRVIAVAELLGQVNKQIGSV